MKPTLHISQLGEYMSQHVAEVFETMLSLPVRPSDRKKAPHFPLQVSGVVGVAGENVIGVVCLHLSEASARLATTTMLGLGPDDVLSQTQINQVIGEVANLLAGGLKAWLKDSGRHCALSLPTIICGSEFSIDPLPEVERKTLVFECDGDWVVVEIHANLD